MLSWRDGCLIVHHVTARPVLARAHVFLRVTPHTRAPEQLFP